MLGTRYDYLALNKSIKIYHEFLFFTFQASINFLNFFLLLIKTRWRLIFEFVKITPIDMCQISDLSSERFQDSYLIEQNKWNHFMSLSCFIEFTILIFGIPPIFRANFSPLRKFEKNILLFFREKYFNLLIKSYLSVPFVLILAKKTYFSIFLGMKYWSFK